MSTPGVGAKTWVEISATAFDKNLKSLHSILDPESNILCVVKSNAYGHDAETITRLAHAVGIRHFGVDSIDEAKKIQIKALDSDILILGFIPDDRREEAIKNDWIQTIYDQQHFELIAQEAVKLQKIARINLKIETGTHRQGIDPKKLEPYFILLRKYERHIKLYGISSHFSDAENPDAPEITSAQHNTFCEVLAKFHQAGFEPPFPHIACSAAAILYPETHFGLARFGIAIYGLWSSEELRRKNKVTTRSIELTPILSWKTRIAQIKDVQTGESVGYSQGFKTNKPIRIAVLPIGYYDGLRRNYAQEGYVLIRGQKCKILGNICMNMCMVDVSHMPQIQKTDIVTILGKDGMHAITAEDIAEKTGTINYEVVTSIQSSLPRFVV